MHLTDGPDRSVLVQPNEDASAELVDEIIRYEFLKGIPGIQIIKHGNAVRFSNKRHLVRGEAESRSNQITLSVRDHPKRPCDARPDALSLRGHKSCFSTV